MAATSAASARREDLDQLLASLNLDPRLFQVHNNSKDQASKSSSSSSSPPPPPPQPQPSSTSPAPYDPVAEFLARLPEVLDDDYLAHEEIKYTKARDVVSQLLSSKVMRNYTAFVHGMTHVQQVQADVQSAASLCHAARDKLKKTQSELAQGGLSIIAKYRKRQRMQLVMNHLLSFREILKLHTRIEHFIEEGDYPCAIQLMLQLKPLQFQYRQFAAIRSLTDQMQCNSDLIEKKLDQSLQLCCRAFDSSRYERAIGAYKLLDSSFDIADKIQKNFLGLTDLCSQQAIFPYAAKKMQALNNVEMLQRLKFQDLCRMVDDEDILCCLLNFLAELTDIIYNYFRMFNWHVQAATTTTTPHSNNNAIPTQDTTSLSQPVAATAISSPVTTSTSQSADTVQLSPPTATASGSQSEQSNANSTDASNSLFDRTTTFANIRNGLHKFRKTLWDTIQRKIAIFVVSCSFTQFKMDRYLHIFHAISMFIELGEEFSESDSLFLRGSLKTQSKSFFQNCHIENLKVLKMMFESDRWTPLEVRIGLSDIKELNPNRADQTQNEPSFLDSQYQGLSKHFRTFLHCSTPSSNPFRKAAARNSFDLKILLNEFEGRADPGAEGRTEPDESVDTAEPSPPSRRPNGVGSDSSTDRDVYTNVSLRMAGYLGTYVSVLEKLPPIALDIFNYTGQLIRFYIYAVFVLFATSKDSFVSDNDASITPLLRASVVEMREHFNQLVPKPKDASSTPRVDFSLSPLDISRPETPFGLIERLTGAESLLFLKKVMLFILPRLMATLPKAQSAALPDFKKNMSELIEDVRTIVYIRSASSLLNLDSYISVIGNSKWDRKTMPTEPTSYVEQMLKQDYTQFAQKLAKIGIESSSTPVPSTTGSPPPSQQPSPTSQRFTAVPEHVAEMLWRFAIKHAMDALVEGFSRAKKCTNEGRAQMAVDLTNLSEGLTSISRIRPVPYVPFVKEYINAFYISSEQEFVDWASRHKNFYSLKQMTNLIMCGVGPKLASKKARTDLIQRVKEFTTDGANSNGATPEM